MISPIQAPSSFQFEVVNQNSSHFPFIKQIFTESLSLDYGNQGFNLERFKSGHNRRCEILLEGKHPRGVIAYINYLVDEFNLNKSFEVRNLILIEEEACPQKKDTIRDQLLQRIHTLAENKMADFIHFPLPNSDKELIQYLEGKGYVKKDNNHPIKQSILYRSILDQAPQSPPRKKVLGKRQSEQKEIPVSKHQKSEGRKQASNPIQAPPRSQIVSGRQHDVTLKKMYIHQIRSGKKTVEGRIDQGMMRRFREGDILRFFYQHNPDDDVKCRIVQITRHQGFAQMLEQCDYKKCLPEVSSMEQAIREYHSIPGYTQRASQNGVLAFHLEVIE